jgi:hypothetical protein
MHIYMVAFRETAPSPQQNLFTTRGIEAVEPLVFAAVFR